jgi:hypothetical protein
MLTNVLWRADPAVVPRWRWWVFYISPALALIPVVLFREPLDAIGPEEHSTVKLLGVMMFILASRVGIPRMPLARSSEARARRDGLVRPNSRPQFAAVLGFLGGALCGIGLVVLEFRRELTGQALWSIGRHSEGIFVFVGALLTFWAWTRPWDIEVKRLVEPTDDGQAIGSRSSVDAR